MYTIKCECDKTHDNFWLDCNCNFSILYLNNSPKEISVRINENYILCYSIGYKIIEKIFADAKHQYVDSYYNMPSHVCNIDEAKTYLIKLKDNLIFE